MYILKKEFLETGRIVNTHGVHGEVKIDAWTNEPAYICGLERIYIDGAPVKILSAKVHKNHVIASLEGIGDLDAAIRLKNKPVYLNRADLSLDDGEFFIQDIIGLDAVDNNTGTLLGSVSDVLFLPAHNVYVISGDREILVPAVPEFIASVDIDGGRIRLRLIEGM